MYGGECDSAADIRACHAATTGPVSKTDVHNSRKVKLHPVITANSWHLRLCSPFSTLLSFSFLASVARAKQKQEINNNNNNKNSQDLVAD